MSVGPSDRTASSRQVVKHPFRGALRATSTTDGRHRASNVVECPQRFVRSCCSATPLEELIQLTAADQRFSQFFDIAITVETRGIALEVRAPAEAVTMLQSLFGPRSVSTMKEHATVVGVGASSSPLTAPGCGPPCACRSR